MTAPLYSFDDLVIDQKITCLMQDYADEYEAMIEGDQEEHLSLMMQAHVRYASSTGTVFYVINGGRK